MMDVIEKTTSRPSELSGDHGKSPDESNTFSLDPGIVVNQGIGISIHSFIYTATSAFGEINFRSVGVQLKID